MPTKSLYFARRNPPIGSDWIRRWRRHGALAMSFESWQVVARYAQCDAIDGLLQPKSTCHNFDGVGSIEYREGGEAALEGLDANPSWRVMQKDEMEIFEGGFTGDFALVLEDYPIKRPEYPAVRVFSFFEGRSEDFESQLVEIYGRRLEAVCEGTLTGLSIGIVKRSAYTANSSIKCDGVCELCFADLDAANRLLGSAEYLELVKNISNEVQVDVRLVATRENVFCDDRVGINRAGELAAMYLTSPI